MKHVLLLRVMPFFKHLGEEEIVLNHAMSASIDFP